MNEFHFNNEINSTPASNPILVQKSQSIENENTLENEEGEVIIWIFHKNVS